jgi:hypothetical protein
VYAHWIFFPATGYRNGYYVLDNYPYYVYNGYRYRYSTYDYCNYQLVDSFDHRVERTYWSQICNTGYDSCSMERDRLNSQFGQFRYFCSETYRDSNYDWSTPSYDDSYYGNTGYGNGGYDNTGYDNGYGNGTGGYDDNTCYDTNHNGTCDNYETTSTTPAPGTCSDYDNDGYCD